MKKRAKTGTVAFATASGFAVVHGPGCVAQDRGSPPIESQRNAAPAKDKLASELETEKA